MKVKGITIEQLNDCLNKVNKDHGYKLIYNRHPERQGNFIVFTIRSEKSGIAGARTSHSGRNMPSASWHAHGYLFDNIWDINPQARIDTGGTKMTNRSFNWQDRNIGSMMQPCMFSSTSLL